MLFLKRLEIVGFKSFAEPTILNFEHEMIGIVGPNGAGKSNITDAIRWVLGEQSSKSLRGDNMEDIVFAGSASYAPLNMAEVTLIFDNSKNFFPEINFSEIEITRRYHKSTRESEFFINKAKVRLKDILDVALATGLTKSSLSIISQGSVNSFVEAKPEERRILFDEAAGVAKYKQRKHESERRLLKTRENLDRLNDIINEIERKLPTLKSQSQKAEEYTEKFEKLKQIEIAVLIQDINSFVNKTESLSKEAISLKDSKSDVRKIADFQQQELQENQKLANKYEKEIIRIHNEHSKLIEEISNLKIKKIALENKITNENSSEIKRTTSKLKIRYEELTNLLIQDQQILETLNKKYTQSNLDIKTVQAELDKCTEDSGSLERQIVRLDSQIESLKNKISNKEGLFEGVKAIIDNKDNLSGVIGIVKDLIEVPLEYEKAVASFLGSTLQNIVFKSVDLVEIASNFLKSNNAGTATFLPLDGLRPNYISKEEQFVIKASDGFIGFGNELVKIKKEYSQVLDYLLANVLFVENFKYAKNLSKLINRKYHIVTLDGERFLPRGGIIGGQRREKIANLNEKHYLQELITNHNDQVNKQKAIKQTILSFKNNLNMLRNTQEELISQIGSFKKNIDINQNDLKNVKDEYVLLNNEDIDDLNKSKEEVETLNVVQEINKLEVIKNELQNKLNIEQKSRDTIIERNSTLLLQLNENRQTLDAFNEKQKDVEKQIIRLDEKITNLKNRLYEMYGLTYDAAKELDLTKIDDDEKTRSLILELKNAINKLGNVNLMSIQEYKEEKKRYDEFQTNVFEIVESIRNLEHVIKEMDGTMVVKIKKLISDVNVNLPSTFTGLFGGGSAKVFFTDPNDVLQSGIDIKINPPGKKINNLNLLSGGEKSLTALSVLFSILKVLPLPLVVLDEVEAPLDPVNVERFAKYLKEFTEKTQFLVVTHRLGTMENCDVLFGVTMEQKGVTKIVPLKLIDLKQTASYK